jgi:hypothetical protein
MKLTKILMCAMVAGAMAFGSDKAQATVISGNLYVPLNIKGTLSYVASAGKIKQATFTSKQILSYLGENYYTFPKGTQLAVGPNNYVYAISKTEVIADLTDAGFFYFEPSDTIDTSTGTFPSTASTYSEAGVVSVGFFSDDTTFVDNQYAFEVSGSYTYNEKDSAVTSGDVNQSSKFKSSNLSGYGYDYDVSDSELPVSGSASGSASGKVPVVL